MNKPEQKPPNWANSFIKIFCPQKYQEEFLSDMEAIFEWRVQEKGLFRAKAGYIFDAINFSCRFFRNPFTSPIPTPDMLQLILKHGFRNLKKEKLYSAINILGLTIGLLSAILIMLYVKEEQSFDKFHTKSNRIYRLYSSFTSSNRDLAKVPYRWGEVLKEEWSALENVATIQYFTAAVPFKYQGEAYAQDGVVAADSTFFELFDFPILQGNNTEFLKSPDKILISPKMATKYFQDKNPIGQKLEINLWGTNQILEVEGIVQSPDNSHLQFECLLPMPLVKKNSFNPKAHTSWKAHFAYTYLLMKEELPSATHYPQIRQYLKDFLKRQAGAEISARYSPGIEALEDTYLKSTLQSDFMPRGNIHHIRILSAVALGVLLMAIINFVNISSARSVKRLKEVGVKKILGSSKRYLVSQLVFESLIISFVSLLFVCLLITCLLPYFNEFLGRTFDFGIFNRSNLLKMFGLTLGVGFILGTYQAIILSSFKPINVIKPRTDAKSMGGKARKGLVVLQFSLAVLMLIATGVVYEQVSYMQEKDLGFDKEQLIIMEDARDVAVSQQKTQLFRESLTKFEQIQYVSASSTYPGQAPWSSRYVPEGLAVEDSKSIKTVFADHEFISTYGLEIKEGRNMDVNRATDSTAFLINEAAAKLFTTIDPVWSASPLNKSIYKPLDKIKGKVIGVVKDFHLNSMKQEIAPLVILRLPKNFFTLQIKVKTANMAETLKTVETSWKTLFPDLPFTYSFADQQFAKVYKSDQQLGKLLNAFAILSIIVAILGLFGLASFMAIEKAKEMSIRKVLGASPNQLFHLLSGLFMKLIFVANLIAIPIGYLLMNQWLAEFSYRVSMPYHQFILAFGITLLVTILTVGFHALKVVRVNPVEILGQIE